jgi:hypothetical protein
MLGKLILFCNSHGSYVFLAETLKEDGFSNSVNLL